MEYVLHRVGLVEYGLQRVGLVEYRLQRVRMVEYGLHLSGIVGRVNSHATLCGSIDQCAGNRLHVKCKQTLCVQVFAAILYLVVNTTNQLCNIN